MTQVFWRVKGFFYGLGGHGLKLIKREAELREAVHDKGNGTIAYTVPLFWGGLYPMPPWRNSITPMIVE